MRTQHLWARTVVAGALLLTACAPAAPAMPAKPTQGAAPAAAAAATSAPKAAASGAPIRIGVPLPTTGPLAVQGKPMQTGIEVAVKQLGGRVAGRPIELVPADDEANPEAALRVTRRLVERDNVDAIVGYLSSAVGYAVRDFIHESKKPAVMMSASAGLTRENKSPYVFRMIPSTFQWAYEPARYLKEKRGYKTLIYWGTDWAASREGFHAVKAVYGDGVRGDLWAPLGTVDFAPYVANIKPQSADVVTIAAWGADGVRIADAYNQTGMRRNMPLFGYASYTSEELLAGHSKDAILGAESAYVYCASLDNQANKEFVSLYTATSGGALPGSYQYASYLGMLMLARAIEAVNGDTSDPTRLAQALEKVKLENTPTGTHSFDANHGWVSDFFWLRVEEENGRLVNRCVDRIPQVADPLTEFPTTR